MATLLSFSITVLEGVLSPDSRARIQVSPEVSQGVSSVVNLPFVLLSDL